MRVRLQAAISSQVRLKRTPQLRFEPDPAIAAGERVEDILRSIGPSHSDEDDRVAEGPDPLPAPGRAPDERS